MYTYTASVNHVVTVKTDESVDPPPEHGFFLVCAIFEVFATSERLVVFFHGLDYP